MVSKLRGALGFKAVNGSAIKITIKKKMKDTIFDKRASKRLTRYVVTQMNAAGKKAEKRAKKTDWTPKLTGALIDSIKWEKAKVTSAGNVVQGRLTAGDEVVDYARIQEFEHKKYRFFLFRAVTQIAQPEFLRRMRRKGPIEGIFAGGIGFVGRQAGSIPS